jgi:ribosome-binding factor A
MEESKRQKQVAGLIQEEITKIFQRLGLSMVEGGMISISSVKITPDLLEARIYVSLFKVADEKIIMKKLENRSWEIKKELAARVKHQLRRIPELKFFHDNTLTQVFKMEELFKQIKKDDESGIRNQELKNGNRDFS